jgi:hypothetical protein
LRSPPLPVQVRCQGASETPQLIDPPFKTDSTMLLGYQALLKGCRAHGYLIPKSLMLMLKFVDVFLLSIFLSIDTGTYTKTPRETTFVIASSFSHEAAPSPAACASDLANSVNSTLKQASILVILPCKRCTTVGPSPIEIGLSREVARCRRIYKWPN